jgi:hypothetical protein
MVVAEAPVIHSGATAAAAAESAQALTGFLSALWEIESVKRLGVSQGRGKLDLWALMAEEVLDDAEKIYLLHRRFRESGSTPVGLHVVPLSEIDAASLPPLRILFER